MKSATPSIARSVCAALLALTLTACGKTPETLVERTPEPIAPGEECHVCGMNILGFPGPKAEVFVRGEERALKFCSTRDLFAFLLQPESAAVVERIYVQDMGVADWENPDGEHMTEARAAWYVVDHPMRGAMGPTLASFRERAAADAFAQRHQGRVLAYDQIDLAVMETLARVGLDAGQGAAREHAHH